MKVIESNPTNFLVLEGGEVESVTRTDTNTLLFDHGLWGLLRDGTDILTLQGTEDEPQVTITPGEDAKAFKLDPDGQDPVYLGEHWKAEFIKKLVATYESDDKSVEPLLNLASHVREMQIDRNEVEALLDVEPFSSAVTEQMGGWLIHDNVLLSWENEFYHPGTTSREIDSGSVARGSSDEAYELEFQDQRPDGTFGKIESIDRTVSTFVSKAAWAVQAAPKC